MEPRQMFSPFVQPIHLLFLRYHVVKFKALNISNTDHPNSDPDSQCRICQRIVIQSMKLHLKVNNLLSQGRQQGHVFHGPKVFQYSVSRKR